MQTWLGRISSTALVIVVGTLLGSCGGSDGGDTEKLFFGINGKNTCRSVVVLIDLEAAGAALTSLPQGAVDCVLDQLLASDGCHVNFTRIDEGRGLRATIKDCMVPPVSGLISCGFQRADAALLMQHTEVRCSCEGLDCGNPTPVCIDESTAPRSCENCRNGRDDDGNGDVDCEDANCRYSALCAATTTTTTNTTQNPPTTTSTSSSTTTSSITLTTIDSPATTTTTTLPEPSFRYAVVFRLHDAVTLGTLQFSIDYSLVHSSLNEGRNYDFGADDPRSRSNGAVQCESLIASAEAVFDDDPVAGRVDAFVTSEAGFTGPTDVARCTFVAGKELVAEDFSSTVTAASDPDSNPVLPLPKVDVESVDPVEETTTTTTTTSGPTTTLPAWGPDPYVVRFRLDDASTALGALQFSTTYSGVSGAFVGAGSSVQCFNQVGGALFAPNNNLPNRKLTLGLIALTAFNSPTDLVTCNFGGHADSPPVAADFPVVIEDSTDGNGDPSTASISVSVAPGP